MDDDKHDDDFERRLKMTLRSYLPYTLWKVKFALNHSEVEKSVIVFTLSSYLQFTLITAISITVYA